MMFVSVCAIIIKLWDRFNDLKLGLDGIWITIDRFGASAPGGKCMTNFGFTVENVVNKTKEIL